MAREFQRSLEQAANESGMNEVSQSLKSLEGVNLRSPVKTARELCRQGHDAASDAPPAPAADAPAAEPAPAPAPTEAGKSAAS